MSYLREAVAAGLMGDVISVHAQLQKSLLKSFGKFAHKSDQIILILLIPGLEYVPCQSLPSLVYQIIQRRSSGGKGCLSYAGILGTGSALKQAYFFHFGYLPAYGRVIAAYAACPVKMGCVPRSHGRRTGR